MAEAMGSTLARSVIGAALTATMGTGLFGCGSLVQAEPAADETPVAEETIVEEEPTGTLLGSDVAEWVYAPGQDFVIGRGTGDEQVAYLSMGESNEEPGTFVCILHLGSNDSTEKIHATLRTPQSASAELSFAENRHRFLEASAPFDGPGEYTVTLQFDGDEAVYLVRGAINANGELVDRDASREPHQLGDLVPLGYWLVMDPSDALKIENGVIEISVTMTNLDDSENGLGELLFDVTTPSGSASDETITKSLEEDTYAAGETKSGVITIPFDGAGVYQVSYIFPSTPVSDVYGFTFELDDAGNLVR